MCRFASDCKARSIRAIDIKLRFGRSEMASRATRPESRGRIAQPEWSPLLLVRVSALGFFGQFAPGLGDLQQGPPMLVRHDARQAAAFLGILPVSCGFAHRPPFSGLPCCNCPNWNASWER